MEYVFGAVFLAFVLVFGAFFVAVLVTLNSAVDRMRSEANLLNQRRERNMREQMTPDQVAERERRQSIARRQEERNRAIYDGGGW